MKKVVPGIEMLCPWQAPTRRKVEDIGRLSIERTEEWATKEEGWEEDLDVAP